MINTLRNIHPRDKAKLIDGLIGLLVLGCCFAAIIVSAVLSK
jgi:hypothetical protein